MILRRIALVFTISLALGCGAQNPAPATGFRIAGTMVDALTGQPLADTNVVIAPSSELQRQEHEVTLRTGTDGHFVFSNLAPGKYSLGASRRGYALQGYDQHEMFATAIVVGTGLDSEHILFRLHPDASIRGTITDEQNDPAPGIRVSLFGLRMENGENSVRHASQTMTDDRGQYSFPHLSEGTYYIAASGRPWYSDNFGVMHQMQQGNIEPEAKARMEQEAAKLDLVYPLTFYSGTLSSDDATPIRLASGDNVTADMALQPVRSVHIRVPALPVVEQPGTQSFGPGVVRGSFVGGSNRRVRLSQRIFNSTVEDYAVMTSMFPERDGSYEIGGIAPGHYQVQFDSPRDSKTPSTSQDVDITGNMDIPASGGAQLAHVNGTMWLNGAPIERGVVEMHSADGSKGYATQVRKGQFQFEQPLPAGRYQVAVLAMANDNLYLSSLTATGAKVNQRSVQILPGASVTLALFTSAGIAQIEGVAKLGDKPSAGVMILLVPEDLANDSRLIRRDQSDSDGTFTLRHVVPGRYRLVAIQNGWSLTWSDPKILQPFLTNAKPYVIQPNQKLQVSVNVQAAK